jgi:hypothetical protein
MCRGIAEASVMAAIPTVRCKVCGREFTPDTKDTDFVEWVFRDEAIECLYCGSYCPIEEIEEIDPDEKR